MNKLQKSHLHKTVKVNKNGVLTVYFFDVWNLELTTPFFEKVKTSPFIHISSTILPTSDALIVADHCPMLEKDTKVDYDLSLVVSPMVRVSMAALVVMKHQGDFLFLIEKGKIKPFGGAYCFTNPLPFKDVVLDDDKSQDLRFSTCASQKDILLDWFDKGQGREQDPTRELVEEMSIENPILSSLEIEEFLKTLVIV